MTTKHLLYSFLIFLIFSCKTSEDNQVWQKGNLHTHSLWSDGDDFPEMIIQWYKENDYQFVALSDHNTVSDNQNRWYRIGQREINNNTLEKYKEKFGDWVEEKIDEGGTYVRLKTFNEYENKLKENNFLIIRSEEVTSGFEGKPVHINVTNIQEKIEPFKGESVLDVMQQTLDAVHEQRNRTNQPMFAHINHPNFGYGISTDDLKKLNGERFFEVYNGHPAVNNEGNEYHLDTESMWDLINIHYYNNDKPLLFGIATDDSHNYHEQSTSLSNTGRGWVMVNTKSLETNNIIAQMEAGNFYSSSGIYLKYLASDNKGISIEIDSEPNIEYGIHFIGYKKGDDNTKLLKSIDGTKAKYVFENDDIFVRVKIVSTALMPNPYKDGETKKAWTQPLIVN
ncbi:MAG: histidinol-phosphatase [Proteobacteria bacterium]|nr:histidinol-phosphatase [Pseudomonadota bacterium]